MPRPLSYKLVVLQGPNSNQEFPRTRAATIIGHDVTQGEDVIIPSAMVLRRHARLERGEGG